MLQRAPTPTLAVPFLATITLLELLRLRSLLARLALYLVGVSGAEAGSSIVLWGLSA